MKQNKDTQTIYLCKSTFFDKTPNAKKNKPLQTFPTYRKRLKWLATKKATPKKLNDRISQRGTFNKKSPLNKSFTKRRDKRNHNAKLPLKAPYHKKLFKESSIKEERLLLPKIRFPPIYIPPQPIAEKIRKGISKRIISPFSPVLNGLSELNSKPALK